MNKFWIGHNLNWGGYYCVYPMWTLWRLLFLILRSVYLIFCKTISTVNRIFLVICRLDLNPKSGVSGVTSNQTEISCLNQKIIILMSLIAFFSVKVVKNSIILIILPNWSSDVQCAVRIFSLIFIVLFKLDKTIYNIKY